MSTRFTDPNIKRKREVLDTHLEAHHERLDCPPLSLVEFNLTGLCNRTCEFCPRVDPTVFPNVDEEITLELYEKILEDLRAVRFDGTILFSAFGEPLLHHRVEDLLRATRERCPQARVEIVTNGDTLTAAKIVALFEAGLTVLAISMYDGPEQIETFSTMRREAGIDESNVILRKRYLPAEEHYGITLSNRAGTLTMEALGIRALDEPLTRPCHYPFYQFLVDHDGKVLLCPHDWGKQLVLGDLNEKSVADIWNSLLLKRTRLGLAEGDRDFSPCRECDVDGTRMGKSHFVDWLEYYNAQHR
jgi:radical SAM protein with 4Fe4S-binding SPASM domain